MAQILVRGVDPETVEKLKQRARQNGRSLQSEVKQILDQAARMTLPEFWATADRIRKSLKGRKFGDSALLIREDRDR